MSESSTQVLSPLCKQNISTTIVETIYHVSSEDSFIRGEENHRNIMQALQMNNLWSSCENNSMQGHC